MRPATPHAVVLGIAQDGGHPQPGCRLSCCSGPEVSPHLTTCIAIVDGSAAWLLDAGPDLPRHVGILDRLGITVAGILLTHAHMGHYTGLAFLGKEAMDTSDLPVWAAPRMAAFLESNGPWKQLLTAGNIDLHGLDRTVELSSLLTVAAFPVPHRDEYSETVGFRVNGPQATLLYVPDTDSWDGWETDIEEHFQATDIAFIDGTFFSGDELSRDIASIAHPTVTSSLRRFSALDTAERAKIHFTHLNHTNPLLRHDSDEYTHVVRSGLAVAAEGQIVHL